MSADASVTAGVAAGLPASVAAPSYDRVVGGETERGAPSPESPQPRGLRDQVADALSAISWPPFVATSAVFVILFAKPIALLVYDWWRLPEAGHGLLLAPVALFLAWRSGLLPDAKPQRILGLTLLILAVLIRCASDLAAELFTMRASVVMALGAITIYHFGFRQLLRWWLPFVLLCLSIPLPELVTQALALPLQFKASQMGAALLEMRNVPVRLSGNVILLPGRQLFVTEACSGLRSLTALLSMAVLFGALMLRTPISRVALVLLAIPVAIVINGIRVFLTGFLVFFVSPAFGEGFMHMSEGWLLFLVSLSVLGAFTWVGAVVERLVMRRREAHA
ncbi:MAG TPA: exosortase/archaeosortase family protein [Gemmatimonadaceae bacterium]|nr:exosortase/archaeosortase family protein [Gemmatimonadaceae bacterium]